MLVQSSWLWELFEDMTSPKRANEKWTYKGNWWRESSKTCIYTSKHFDVKARDAIIATTPHQGHWSIGRGSSASLVATVTSASTFQTRSNIEIKMGLLPIGNCDSDMTWRLELFDTWSRSLYHWWSLILFITLPPLLLLGYVIWTIPVFMKICVVVLTLWPFIAGTVGVFNRGAVFPLKS